MDTTNSITIPDSDSIMTTSTSPATAALVKTIEISLKGLHQNQRTALLLYITRHEIDNGFACDCQGSEHSYLDCTKSHASVAQVANRFMTDYGFLDNVCNSCLTHEIAKPYRLVADPTLPHALSLPHGRGTNCRMYARQIFTRAATILSKESVCTRIGAPLPNGDASLDVDAVAEWLRKPYHVGTRHRGLHYNMHLCVLLEFFLRPSTNFTPSCITTNLGRFTTGTGIQSYNINPTVLRLDGISPGNPYSKLYFDSVAPHWSTLGGGGPEKKHETIQSLEIIPEVTTTPNLRSRSRSASPTPRDKRDRRHENPEVRSPLRTSTSSGSSRPSRSSAPLSSSTSSSSSSSSSYGLPSWISSLAPGQKITVVKTTTYLRE